VGEPRLLICLYENPLLHVDIKFLTLQEFQIRVEDPVILFDRDNQLQNVLDNTLADFPKPGHQWIEDRFWTWVHYALLKIGRGEYLEALDFLAFLRTTVFGPLLHIKNQKLPRGVRKVETGLPQEDLEKLLHTVPTYNRGAILYSLRKGVDLYRELRIALYDEHVTFHLETEKKVMEYFEEIENREH
jgi:hypothetical protein